MCQSGEICVLRCELKAFGRLPLSAKQSVNYSKWTDAAITFVGCASLDVIPVRLECQLVLRRALLWWLENIELALKFWLFVNNRGKSWNVCWTCKRTVERRKNVGWNVLGWITGSKSLNRIHHQFSRRILSDFYVVGKNGKIFATSGKPRKSSHKRDRSKSKYCCRKISIPFASNKEDAFARKFSCAEARKRW